MASESGAIEKGAGFITTPHPRAPRRRSGTDLPPEIDEGFSLVPPGRNRIVCSQGEVVHLDSSSSVPSASIGRHPRKLTLEFPGAPRFAVHYQTSTLRSCRAMSLDPAP